MSTNWSTYQGSQLRAGYTSQHLLSEPPAGEWCGGSSSDPVVFAPVFGPDGTIYFVTSNGVVTAQTTPGENLWTFQTGSPATGLTLSADGTLLYLGTTTAMVAVTASGTSKWSYPSPHGSAEGFVLADDGYIYVMFGPSPGQTAALGLRLHALSGALQSTFTGRATNGCPPAYRGNIMVFNTAGGPAWYNITNAGSVPLPTGFAGNDPGVTSVGSPVFDSAGNAYGVASIASSSAASESGAILGRVVSLNVNGSSRWQCNLGTTPSAWSSPVLSPDEQTVYVAADGIYAIEAATGNLIPSWQYNPSATGLGIQGSMIATADNGLYVIDPGFNALSMADATTGLFKMNTSLPQGNGQSAPVPAGALSVANDGSVYLNSTDGSLWRMWCGSSTPPTPPPSSPAVALIYGVSYPPAIQKLSSQAITPEASCEFSPSGLVVSSTSSMVWWTEGSAIKKAPVAGGTTVTAVSSLAFNPVGLAVDEAGNRAFCCDMSAGTVVAISLADGTVQTLVSGLGSPVAVAVDLTQSLLFWAEYKSGKVQKAGLDGSNVTALATGLDLPQSVVVDPGSQRVYWAGKTLVEGCGYDGGSRSTVATLAAAQPSYNSRKLAMDSTAGKLFWTDQASQSIQQASTDGSGLATVVSHATTSSFSNPSVLAVTA